MTSMDDFNSRLYSKPVASNHRDPSVHSSSALARDASCWKVRVLVITLAIFSGRRDPQWTVDTNHPKFDEIQQLLKDARMHNFTYNPEQMPARLGYKGFLVKSENNVELIVGNETVRLQQLLLESIPEDVLPHKNRDWVLAAINAGNVKAGVPY